MMNTQHQHALTDPTYIRHKYFTAATFTAAVREHGLWPWQHGLSTWLCEQLEDVPHPAYVADLELVSVPLQGWMRGYSESLRSSPELRVTLYVYLKIRGHPTREGVCVRVPTALWLHLPDMTSPAGDAAPLGLVSGMWFQRDYDALEADGLHSYEEWMDEELHKELPAHWARERRVEPRFISTAELTRAMASTAPNVRMDCCPHGFIVDALDRGPHPAYFAGTSQPPGADAHVFAIVRAKLKGLDDVKTIAVRLPARDWYRLPMTALCGLLAART